VRAAVSRTRCSVERVSAERCTADPGPFQRRCVERSRVCSASLRAALRPGHRQRYTRHPHVRDHPQDPKLQGCRLSPIHTVKQPPLACRAELTARHPHRTRNSPSRCASHRAPGPNLLPSSATPEPRGRRSADRRVFVVMVPRGSGAARTLRSVRSPLGAPPWRFWAGSPRLSCPALPPAPSRGPRRPALQAWPAAHKPPGPRLQTAAAGRHTRSAIRIVSGDAPSSSGIMHITPDAIRSQQLNSMSSAFSSISCLARRPHRCRAGNGTLKWIGFPRIVCAQDRLVGPIPTAKADQPRNSRPHANTPFKKESTSSGSFRWRAHALRIR
jgi:hypothetical protein